MERLQRKERSERGQPDLSVARSHALSDEGGPLLLLDEVFPRADGDGEVFLGGLKILAAVVCGE